VPTPRACGNCFHSHPHPTLADYCWCVAELPRLGARIVENKDHPELEGERLGEWPLVPITFRCGAWRPLHGAH
jgi:hypothetical protein